MDENKIIEPAVPEIPSSNGTARKKKEWTKKPGDNSWTMFKVMAEFVDGFETLNKIGPCISIFGSARTKPGTYYYDMAVKIANKLTEEGYGIITGGGPGIMEAGNRGAKNAKGRSVGLHIELEFEQDWNNFIDADKLLIFRYFFARKVMFIRYAQAFVFMPGGFGTMDEVFETLTLIQTRKIDAVPIIFVGTEYWKGLMDWIKGTMLAQENYINPIDLNLFEMTDDPEEIARIINKHYQQEGLKPNF